MDQRRCRRLAHQLLDALEAAAAAQNDCLAFCLYQGLMIELAGRLPAALPSRAETLSSAGTG